MAYTKASLRHCQIDPMELELKKDWVNPIAVEIEEHSCKENTMEDADLLKMLRRDASKESHAYASQPSMGLKRLLVEGARSKEKPGGTWQLSRLRLRSSPSLSITMVELGDAWLAARNGLRKLGGIATICGDEICRLLPRARPNSLASFARSTNLPAARQAVARAWIAVNAVRSRAPEEDRSLFDPILESVAHFGRLLRDLERDELTSLDSESMLCLPEWLRTPPKQTSIFDFFEEDGVSDEEQAYARSMSALRLDEGSLADC